MCVIFKLKVRHAFVMEDWFHAYRYTRKADFLHALMSFSRSTNPVPEVRLLTHGDNPDRSW